MTTISTYFVSTVRIIQLGKSGLFHFKERLNDVTIAIIIRLYTNDSLMFDHNEWDFGSV